MLANIVNHTESRSYLKGTIITRAFLGDFPDEEYHRIMRGPYTNRLPDTYTLDGVPVYYLSEFELKWAEKTLDRFCVDRFETHNIACNAGRTNVLNYLGNTIDQGIRYFSVGTGVGTPAATDTAMFSDYFRKPPTTVTIVGNQTIVSTNFSTSEGNTTYTEAGLIGGSTAVVTPGGAGTLFAHTLYSYTKTSSISLTNGYYMQLA